MNKEEVYDSRQDTMDHIAKVQVFIGECRMNLRDRAIAHDRSKLSSPEKEAFDRVTPKLRSLTYGSPEYHAATKELGEALQHHYAENRHHPEHWTHGVNDMTLLDIIEMLCDWKAAGLRMANGDLGKSIENNRDRFGLSPQLTRILYNTAKDMGWLRDEFIGVSGVGAADTATRGGEG